MQSYTYTHSTQYIKNAAILTWWHWQQCAAACE